MNYSDVGKYIIVIILILLAIYINLEVKSKKIVQKVPQGIDYNINPGFLKYFNKFQYKNLNDINVINNNKIFISIASYRDPECYNTVKSIIKNSKSPEKLKIVVCQQNSAEDIFSFNNENIREIFKKIDIKIIDMDYKKARGPCWARFLIQQEWNGEEYFLQIDSHTKFVKNWDEKLKNELRKLPEKSCLSNYVSIYDVETQKIITPCLRKGLKAVEISEKDNLVRYNSDYYDIITSCVNNIKYQLNINHPIKSKGWSACFSFSKSDILHDAPYDPYVPFLFFGEESDIFCRLYSRNWKFYVPSISICFTCFNRSYRKTFWENNEYLDCNKMSKLRIYYKFGMLKDVDQRILTEIDKYKISNGFTYKQCLDFMFS